MVNNECQDFKKNSKQYVVCMNEFITSTNTAKNLKELKKHNSLESFFKQVEVLESN